MRFIRQNENSIELIRALLAHLNGREAWVLENCAFNHTSWGKWLWQFSQEDDHLFFLGIKNGEEWQYGK